MSDGATGGEGRLTRRRLLQAGGAGGVALLVPDAAVALAKRATRPGPPTDVVLQWNNALLQGVRDSKLGPPMVSRALAVAHTCIYEAWAAYDRVAVGTRLHGELRRPPRERQLQNRVEAVSFAAYRAAVDLFPSDTASVFDPLMARLGFDPSNHSTDVTTPAGIGNFAAQAVLDFRHRDGANQLGDEPGGTPGVPYSDYTGFEPVNEPMDTRAPLDLSTVHDPNRWQPLTYVDATGTLVTPAYVAPHWGHVRPFGMNSASKLRSRRGPAQLGSRQFASQAEQLIRFSAGLTDAHKLIAEYWADGPHSEQPPGHWNLFAQHVLRREGHGEHLLDRSVKLLFAITNAIFDAGCCAWDDKRAFDSVRPITAIRYLFVGKRIRAWAGPGRGTRTIHGESWFPYQATTFPTPPFPEYASGHSNFSAAGAEILRRYTGSDRFGASVTFAAGSSKFEPGIVPARPVTLRWPTFSAAAAQAGISRRYGGIHFQQGDLDARATGREAARQCWAKTQRYFDGSAA